MGEDGDIRKPTDARSCTDVPCCLVFLIYLGVFAFCSYELLGDGDYNLLMYGKNVEGKFCGLDPPRENKYLYWPNVARDIFEAKSEWEGICVPACPLSAGLFGPPQDKERHAPYPTVPTLGRCLPAAEDDSSKKVMMCRQPECPSDCQTDDDIVCKAMKMCGIKDDNGVDTSKYWFITMPTFMVRQELDFDQNDIQNIYSTEQHKAELEGRCIVRADRQVEHVQHLDGTLLRALQQYTTGLFRQLGHVVSNWKAIAIIGVGLAFVWGLVLILGLSSCARVIAVLAFFMLILSLVVTDYILLCKAGVISGKHAELFLEKALQQHKVQVGSQAHDLLTAAGSGTLVVIYKVLAGIVTLMVLFLTCLSCFLRQNLDVMVALVGEASKVVRQMPALFLVPVLQALIIVSFVLCTGTIVACIVTSTKETESVARIPYFSDFANKNPESLEKIILTIVLFSALWVYYFVQGFCHLVVACSTSHWYFFHGEYGEGRCCGLPLVLGTVCRMAWYHLGSVALGSFVLAVCTLLRIALEYLDNQTQEAQRNEVAGCLMRCAKCCLYCFETCLKYLTSYTYVNIAVTGKSFCSAARDTFALIMKHPAQLALNELAIGAMGKISCLTSVCVNICIFSFCGEHMEGWFACAVVIAVLSWVVTCLVLVVYMTCVSTLFVAFCHDTEHFQGRYTGTALREAMNLKRGDEHLGIELAQRGQMGAEGPGKMSPYESG